VDEIHAKTQLRILIVPKASHELRNQKIKLETNARTRKLRNARNRVNEEPIKGEMQKQRTN